MTKDAHKAGQSPGDDNYLESVHANRGIGYWRSLYVELLNLPPLNKASSIIELGAGSPDFLQAVPMKRKAAVDLSSKYKHDFEAENIAFYERDLERSNLNDLGSFEVAVCSDVFEHLLRPHILLKNIESVLGDEGVLLSHVPNEYAFVPTVLIMLGLRTGLYFHKDQEEWTDPHIRRFTDVGYREFLSQSFQYNLKITHFRYNRVAKTLRFLKLPVPLALEGGPTYISTNSESMYEKLKHLI